MNTTLAERKNQAIKYLKQLNVYKPYIKGFEEENLTCFFENYGGFWTYQDEELSQKIKEIEDKYNCTVYAVTHEYTDFGELYDLLIVTDYPEEWEQSLYSDGKAFYAFAYVWNKSDDWCSEFGTIGVNSLSGGIRRIA